ncbi:MAG TPA: hypothetical protein GXX51_01720 [Firmicutes bacterium]|nr:hypothetical protein [Bacillota bacterium]
MLFLVGLDQLSRDEKVNLLAQLNSLTGWNVLNQGAQKGMRQVKNLAFNATAWVASKVSREYERNIKELSDRLDWDVEVIQKKAVREVDCLSGLTSEQVSRLLRKRIAEIGRVDVGVDDLTLAKAIIHRAARSLGMDPRLYGDLACLETAVFERCIQEQMAELKKRLQRMSPSQLNDFERILRDEISRLSGAEQEAIRKVIDLDRLSADGVVAFLKSISSAAIAQVAVGGLGFGPFLFLTTTMKALSLLLGITLSFGTYTFATSALAFLLSAPFLFIIAGMAGGLILRSTSWKVNDHLTKLLIFIGRGKLLRPI